MSEEGYLHAIDMLSNCRTGHKENKFLADYSLYPDVHMQSKEELGCVNLLFGKSSEEQRQCNYHEATNRKRMDTRKVVTPWPLASREDYQKYHSAVAKELFSRDVNQEQYVKDAQQDGYAADLKDNRFLVLPLVKNWPKATHQKIIKSLYAQ